MHQLRLLSATAFLALGVGLASAQAPTWTALTAGAQPGTPVEWTEQAGSSSPQISVFELRIHGFWQTPIVGPNGISYTRVEFPGLGTIGQVGAPELPAARPWIAVTTSAVSAQLVSAVTPPGETATFTLRPYPQPVPGLDEPIDPTNSPGAGNGAGTPEVFSVDTSIYTGTAVWPPTIASASATKQTWHATLPLAQPEIFPARFTPTTLQLTVSRRMIVTYSHTGSQLTFAPINIDRWKLGRAMCVNWTTAGAILAADPLSWKARYLFVAPQALVPTLQTLVDRRRDCGFVTSIVTLESLSSASVAAIRSAIQSWYAAGDPARDHYCLLVGDASALPLAPSPLGGTNSPSDDPYGSIGATANLREQVYVGRLSVDDAADLAHQIAKIVAYEEDTNTAHEYSRATVASHQDAAPAKYQHAVNGLAAIPYVDPPIFTLRHGSSLGSTGNSKIAGDLAEGRGVLAYRGHGTANMWFGWSGTGVGWHKNDVIGLTNSMKPVVWSVACNHNRIDESIDSLGETWLEADAGAVAHYGATRAGATRANDALLAGLFTALYDDGIATHGPLVALAEDRMLAAHPAQADTAWGMLLLGDPAMRVRRHKPNGLQIASPATIQACGSSPCFYTVQLKDGNGVPIVGGLVTAYKPGDNPSLPDEVFFTGVTDSNGNTTIPGPTTLGTLNHIGRDDTGDVAQDLPQVQTGAFVSLGDALAGFAAQEPELESASWLLPGTQLLIQLEDAKPGTAGVMAMSLVDTPTPLFGGIVHTFPVAAQFPVATNLGGKWSFVYAAWPDGIPPGSTFYFQVGLVDPAAIQGFSLSNCLLGTTP